MEPPLDEQKQSLLEAKASLNSLSTGGKEQEKLMLRKPSVSELPKVESVEVGEREQQGDRHRKE